MTQALTLEHFAGHVGETYQVAVGDGAFDFVLESAKPLGISLRETGSFALTFRGPPETVLEQAIYAFSRDGEALDIFIVPVARDDAGIRYEAVFN